MKPASRSSLRALPLLAALTAACGSNTPEIPPELLGSSGCSATNYPAGPYGAQIGDLAQNLCFQGFRSPDAETAAERASSLESVAFADFYDPTGARYELMLVNTAAIWCSACQVEHQTLPEHVSELASRGLVVLSALFQNGQGEPADSGDLVVWVETFEPNFPMVLDPDYQMGIYASAETAPLNLVVDARTMRIVDKYIGDQAAVLWPAIEQELGRRD